MRLPSYKPSGGITQAARVSNVNRSFCDFHLYHAASHCLTTDCKALNKECDGGRPYCMRCITAARACAGYLEYVRQSRDASWWECEICAREVDSKQWGWSCPDCDLVNPKRIQDEYLARVRALNPPPHTSRPSFEANSTREERRLDVTDPTRLTGWQVCHIVIVIGLFTFAGSLALGLGWSVARNDVSGGFTMAAYVVAVGGIPLAFVQIQHNQRCKCWKSRDRESSEENGD